MTTKITWAWYHLTAAEWSAFSTIGTFFGVAATVLAVFAAVKIPLDVANKAQKEARDVEAQRRVDAIMDSRRAQREKDRELAARYHEVASATYDGIEVMGCAIEAWQNVADTAFLTEAAKATAIAEALRILIRVPGLTDGPIVSGAAIASALDCIARAAKLLREEQASHRFSGVEERRIRATHPAIIDAEIASGFVLAKAAEKRIERVVAARGIAIRAGQPLPKLPEDFVPRRSAD